MELFINGIVPSYRSAVALPTGTKKCFKSFISNIKYVAMCKNCQKWLSHFINVSICVAKTLSEKRLGHKLLFQNRN